MDILGLLLDVPAPPVPGSSELPKDSLPANTTAAEEAAKAAEKSGGSNLTLYLVIAGAAVLLLAAWYFWNRFRKAKNNA